jgi:hypothetical protein
MTDLPWDKRSDTKEHRFGACFQVILSAVAADKNLEYAEVNRETEVVLAEIAKL